MSKPTQKKHWCCNVSVLGKSGACDEVVDRLLDEMKLLGWSEKDCFGVQLAFEEALSNAIKHGNASNPNKHVHVCCDVQANCIKIGICDEGAGFDPESVPDPRHPDNLLVPSGRGIFLIKHIMSKVEFSPCGNGITMTKYKTM